MDANDIADIEDLESWMLKRKKRENNVVAVRAALRVAPNGLCILAAERATPSQGVNDPARALIAWFRCLIIASVSARFETRDKFSELADAANTASYDSLEEGAVKDIELLYAAAGQVVRASTKYSDQITDQEGAIYNAELASGPNATRHWREINLDVASIEKDGVPLETSLWRSKRGPARHAWTEASADLARADGRYEFWIRWYDAILDGKPLLPTWDAHWAMLEQIALIATETWDAGPTAVAKAIREIELEFVKAVPKPVPFAVREAVNKNAETLPAQLEALFETIDGEIERLRGKNPKDDMEAKDVERLKSIFEKMRGVVENLAVLLPDSHPIDAAKAEDVGSLLSVYAAEFQKWPRENAADLVDGTCRVRLVGLTAGLMAACGAPWLAGVAAGGLVFGGKRLADMRNAAKSFNPDG